MNRILSRLVLCFSLFVLSMLSLNLHAGSKKKAAGKNLLLITIDTLRADRLSCYRPGHLKTPNIDGLASRGTLFTRAFAHTPTTLPSHTNILLGTTPLYHGVHDNFNFVVTEEMTTLAEFLKDQGYSTGAFIGAYPLDARFGLNQGFMLYDDDYGRSHGANFYTPERPAEIVVNKALGWLDKQDSSWFLWIHCYDPHTPYSPPEPYKTRFADNLYNGEVAYIDAMMGKLFSYMDNKNMSEKTVVIFTGDHGESLGEHGEETHAFFAYNSTIWIPLIISSPGIKPNQATQTVAHIDIFPTICDILQIKKPAFLQGRSLLPAMQGKKLKTRPVFFESLYPYYNRGWAPIKGYIKENEKFIDTPIYELYNLEQDFNERNNILKLTNVKKHKDYLDKLIKDMVAPDSDRAKRDFNRKAAEKLQSLGYMSGYNVNKKTMFGPSDDVKTLLPFHYQTEEAWDIYQAGNASRAIEILKKVIFEQKNVDMAYKRLAGIYAETGKIKAALDTLELGLKQFPASYEIYSDYLKTLNNANKFREIILESTEADYPEMDLDPEFWNILGIAYAQTGALEKALETFEKALSLDENFPELLHNIGKTYHSLGNIKKDNQLLKKAEEMFKQAIALDPSYPKPYSSLGNLYRTRGEIKAAIQYWKNALKMDPDDSGALYNMGIASLGQKDFTNAYAYLTKYKKLYYPRLSLELQRNLDKLIQKCAKIS